MIHTRTKMLQRIHHQNTCSSSGSKVAGSSRVPLVPWTLLQHRQPQHQALPRSWAAAIEKQAMPMFVQNTDLEPQTWPGLEMHHIVSVTKRNFQETVCKCLPGCIWPGARNGRGLLSWFDPETNAWRGCYEWRYSEVSDVYITRLVDSSTVASPTERSAMKVSSVSPLNKEEIK